MPRHKTVSGTLSKDSNTRQLKKKAKLHRRDQSYNISHCFLCWKNCIHSDETKSIFLKNYRKLSGVTEKSICELLWEVKPMIIKNMKKSACMTYWNRVFKHCYVNRFFPSQSCLLSPLKANGAPPCSILKGFGFMPSTFKWREKSQNSVKFRIRWTKIYLLR